MISALIGFYVVKVLLVRYVRRDQDICLLFGIERKQEQRLMINDCVKKQRGKEAAGYGR